MSYEVVTTIARGGMGTVDLGRGRDGRAVALKRLTLFGSAERMHAARQRLVREAELLRQLDHPAIVGLLDVRDEGGELVLVMPYLEGGTLAERVARDGPLSPADVRTLMADLLGALAAAHRAGVVHRDVKPGNVLFDGAGRPHLADFGVATTRDATGGLTSDGAVVGTPGYLSPEQARGEAATAASDVFSLGATLHFALTGQSPFGPGDPQVVLYRTAKRRPAPLPRRVDRDLRRTVASMLDVRADRRPTAAALAHGPDGTLVLPPPAPRRNRVVPAVVVAVVAVTGALAWAARGSDGGATSADESEVGAAVTTTACPDLPYQPCGQPTPAPFTDGRRCIDDHADYDANPRNGCEAAPLGPDDGSELDERIEANLVPSDDTDTFVAVVDDRGQLLCDGRFRLTITAPEGAAVRLVVLEPDGDVAAETTSADGVPNEVALGEPSCGGDDSTTFTLEVTSVGSDRTAEPYVLERRGSF